MSFKVISMFSGAGGLDMGFIIRGSKYYGLMILPKMRVILMINGQIIKKMVQEKMQEIVQL